jgi:signal transduction histidine kinase
MKGMDTRWHQLLINALARWRLFNLSLAAKCRVLFGLAVLLIIAVALSVPWYRMELLVEQGKGGRAQVITDAYLYFDIHAQYSGTSDWSRRFFSSDLERQYPKPTLIRLAGETLPADLDELTEKAIARFRADKNLPHVWHIDDTQSQRRYLYLQAVRAEEACMSCHEREFVAKQPVFRKGQLVGVMKLALPTAPTDQQLLWNRMAIGAAVALATLCAIAVFYLITHWLILAPTNQLRQAAEKVASGQVDTRVNIKTGDELEELGRAFNQMLDHLEDSQSKLRTINKSLDAKLGELAEANVALYETNRIKSEFLANVSHELRTPLNSIIGFTELLESNSQIGDDPKFQRYLTNILTSARSLLRIINELLDLAKIEAGKMELHIEKLALSDLCENLYNFIKPLADKKNLQVDLVLEDHLPVMETDAGKLQQILYNLLSNAIKFTPDGGRIVLRGQTVPPEHVRISVSDTGPGIPQSQHEIIFEKFRQTDGSASREHGGVGLGLAIAKELATMMGGTVDVASTPGEGATFSITIPLKIQAKEIDVPLVKL